MPENGKVVLDKEKFSLLQRSTNFSRILKQIEESSNNESNDEEETKPVGPINELNNSTLINLSFNDDNFQKQTLLDFAAIK